MLALEYDKLTAILHFATHFRQQPECHHAAAKEQHHALELLLRLVVAGVRKTLQLAHWKDHHKHLVRIRWYLMGYRKSDTNITLHYQVMGPPDTPQSPPPVLPETAHVQNISQCASIFSICIKHDANFFFQLYLISRFMQNCRTWFQTAPPLRILANTAPQ